MNDQASTVPLPSPSPNPSPDDALITLAQVGRLLGGAGKRKIRSLVERGRFNTYRLDGRTLYSRNEIQKYIGELKRTPARAPWRGDGPVTSLTS